VDRKAIAEKYSPDPPVRRERTDGRWLPKVFERLEVFDLTDGRANAATGKVTLNLLAPRLISAGDFDAMLAPLLPSRRLYTR
jgi:hypothetical protein